MNKIYDKKEFLKYMNKWAKEMYPGELSYSDCYHAMQTMNRCEEWHSYSNFEIWFNSHLQGNDPVELDKDILYKGNKVYSAETCCLVPHYVNTLFLACNSNRGDLPIGVWYDKEKSRYRANMSCDGESQKLGSFKTAEEAFKKFKDYKENLIKEVAEQYKNRIRKCVYDTMMNWEIKITDQGCARDGMPYFFTFCANVNVELCREILLVCNK